MTAATKVKEIDETISWRSYYELCKPKVVYLIVFTAFVGMLLAHPGGLPPLDILIAANFGIGLAAASGAALNHIVHCLQADWIHCMCLSLR